MSEPIVVIPDPDDPDYVYMNRCPLCGIEAAKHTEQACQKKMAEWKPVGILAALKDLKNN